MTLSLFGFVSRLQDHISLSDTFDTVIIHIGMYLAKIVYHYRKRQLVSTDRYQFRSIEKLMESVSVDRVAYLYLDTFP